MPKVPINYRDEAEKKKYLEQIAAQMGLTLGALLRDITTWWMWARESATQAEQIVLVNGRPVKVQVTLEEVDKDAEDAG